MTWTVAGERLAVLAWPRAILLQFAHPLVAAGVAQHSGFRASPFAPFARLHATVSAMRRITFGTDAEAAATIGGIRAIHDRVNGAVDATTGAYPAGTRYSAHDPDLLLWVYATLIDSHVRVLEPIFGPFSPDDLDSYCLETASLALALGVRPHQLPRTWLALQAYMAAELSSGRIVVGDEARRLAAAVLRPTLGPIVWPLQYAGELVTVGALPTSIRRAYGFDWNPTHERRRRRVLRLVRLLRGITPDCLARWPEARKRAVRPAGASFEPV